MTSRSYELRLEGIGSLITGEFSLRDPSALVAPQQQTVTRIARHLARLASAVAVAVITGAAHASAQPTPLWTTIPLAGPIESVDGVTCQHAGTCLAVASVPSGMFPGGAILRSSDLGRTSTNVPALFGRQRDSATRRSLLGQVPLRGRRSDERR